MHDEGNTYNGICFAYKGVEFRQRATLLIKNGQMKDEVVTGEIRYFDE